jgi:beta-ureidopropionase / N-carbamoyl-L-amino-acid hydrolase
MRALGLAVRVDRIGNVFGIRAGSRATRLPPVMTGSHIDTVATGGRYDGNYGVLAGLEVVRWLNEHGLTTRAPAGGGRLHQRGGRALPARHDGLAGACRRPAAAAGAGCRGTDGVRLGDELARIGYAGDVACGRSCRMPSSSCTSSRAR